MARRRRKHERPVTDPADGAALQGELLGSAGPVPAAEPEPEVTAAAGAEPPAEPEPAAERAFSEPESGPLPEAEADPEPVPEPAPEPPRPAEPVVFELVDAPARAEVEAERDAGAEPHGAPPAAGPQGERLARARELTTQGRIDEAVALYREIVQDAPRNVKARNNLGVLFDELGQHELALEQLEAARAVDPEGVEVLTNLGSALGALGRYEDAERELRRAQRLAPEAVGVRASLGILYFRRGLYAQAEQELRWVCDHDPDHGPAHFYRGEALNRLGRVDPALEALERAVRLQPHNHRAYYTMGILFDRKNLRDEAAAMYRKSRELRRP